MSFAEMREEAVICYGGKGKHRKTRPRGIVHYLPTTTHNRATKAVTYALGACSAENQFTQSELERRPIGSNEPLLR
jgi:hypothetical protein